MTYDHQPNRLQGSSFGALFLLIENLMVISNADTSHLVD